MLEARARAFMRREKGNNSSIFGAQRSSPKRRAKRRVVKPSKNTRRAARVYAMMKKRPSVPKKTTGKLTHAKGFGSGIATGRL